MELLQAFFRYRISATARNGYVAEMLSYLYFIFYILKSPHYQFYSESLNTTQRPHKMREIRASNCMQALKGFSTSL